MGNRSIEEIRHLISGPVSSIFTPFERDGAIDWNGVRNIVERSTEGSNVTLITYGNSQLEYLTDDELATLTRVAVEQSRGRSLIVASSRPWSTQHTVEFASYCKELGTDAIMLYLGEYTRTAAGSEVVALYKAVAQELPVMIVGWPTHEVLDQLADEPNICSMKEDGTIEYAIDTVANYHAQWQMISGGGLHRHFCLWPSGCQAFMSVWSFLKPEVNHRYWQALQSNDLQTACEVVSQNDNPLFAFTSKYRGGNQTAWRGIFEILGISSRYRRAPMPSLTDAEMEMLREDIKELGLSG